MSNCIDFLNSYADSLSSITTPLDTQDGYTKTVRPQPLFFSGANCSGSLFNWSLLEEISVSNNDSTVSANGFHIRSFYLPSNWGVTFDFHNKSSTSYPSNDSLVSQSIILDSVSISPTDIKLHFPKKRNLRIQTANDWIYSMCTGEIQTVVGTRYLTSFQPGNIECDIFMNDWCQSHTSSQECACLQDEKDLKLTFCPEGNTADQCLNDLNFNTFIPVTCFGKNCSSHGYRFGRMRNQNCNIKLCQQIIDISNESNTTVGGSSLYCGNTKLSDTPKDGDNADGSGDNNEGYTSKNTYLLNIPVYLWVIIAIGLLTLCLVVPLSVIVFKHRLKKTKKPKNIKI